MGEKDNKIRVRIFLNYLAMYIPLLILYKILGPIFVREVEGINFMMTVIAIPCCIVYYKITKKNNFFLYLLFYLSLLIDNTYIHVQSFYGTVDRTVPLLLIFREGLILLITLEWTSAIEWISKHKIIISILFVSCNIIILITNNTVANILYSYSAFNLFMKCGIAFILFIVLRALIKSFKSKEFIEIIFLSSVAILIIRRASMFIKYYIGYNGNIFFDEKWAFCFALYILPIGLFVEYRCIAKEKLKLEVEVESISKDMKEFQEIDKLRTQFFANISHEIKTPINIIFSGMQLIESKRKDGETAMLDCYNKYEPMIKQNCFRILRLTNNLVDMTKLDAGFMKMNFINVDIVKLVEDITMSVVKYVENKHVNIIFDTLIEEKVVRCDKDGIERIILNLISNSLKFTNKDGNILVFMELEDGYVVIRVKDDGIGIPKENRESVFNVFVQGDKSLNRVREGSGIGLSLVKAIVEKHDGIVKCEDVEVGTEIVVKIPDIVLEESEVNCNNRTYNDDIIEKINTEFSDIYDL